MKQKNLTREQPELFEPATGWVASLPFKRKFWRYWNNSTYYEDLMLMEEGIGWY